MEWGIQSSRQGCSVTFNCTNQSKKIWFLYDTPSVNYISIGIAWIPDVQERCLQQLAAKILCHGVIAGQPPSVKMQVFLVYGILAGKQGGHGKGTNIARRVHIGSRDANFSICRVVIIAEGNRRMPKAFVGGGYGRGASPLSLWGGSGGSPPGFFKKITCYLVHSGAIWAPIWNLTAIWFSIIKYKYSYIVFTQSLYYRCGFSPRTGILLGDLRIREHLSKYGPRMIRYGNRQIVLDNEICKHNLRIYTLILRRWTQIRRYFVWFGTGTSFLRVRLRSDVFCAVINSAMGHADIQATYRTESMVLADPWCREEGIFLRVFWLECLLHCLCSFRFRASTWQLSFQFCRHDSTVENKAWEQRPRAEVWNSRMHENWIVH